MTTFDIQLTPEAARALDKIEDHAGLMRALAAELATQNQLTVGHIVKTRLTGKGPFPVAERRLGEVSHTYRRVLQAKPPVIAGNNLESSIGANLPYAAAHEFGATINRVQLAGSVRLRTDARGNLLRTGRNGNLARFARASHKRFANVPFAGGKRYTITIPERAPVRTGMAERLEATALALGERIISFWKN